MKAKTRYFIVMYVSNCSELGHITGQTSFQTKGSYLNKTKSIEMIKERGFKNEHVITNIIELSKRDYEDWTEK